MDDSKRKKAAEDVRKTARGFITDKEFNAELKKTFESFSKDFKSDEKEPDLNNIIALTRKGDDGKRKSMLIAIAVSGDDWEDWGKRSQMLMGLGIKVAEDKYQVVVAYLISEVWMATKLKGDKSKLPPSERPDRKEGFMVAGRTIDGRENMAIAELKKDRTLSKVKYEYYGGDKMLESNNRMLSAFFKGHILGTVQEMLKV